MDAWYLSYNRFEKRIIKRWQKSGFKYHAGHVQLLKYAYRTLTFWAMVNQNKISQKNQRAGHPTLF